MKDVLFCLFTSLIRSIRIAWPTSWKNRVPDLKKVTGRGWALCCRSCAKMRPRTWLGMNTSVSTQKLSYSINWRWYRTRCIRQPLLLNLTSLSSTRRRAVLGQSPLRMNHMSTESWPETSLKASTSTREKSWKSGQLPFVKTLSARKRFSLNARRNWLVKSKSSQSKWLWI